MAVSMSRSGGTLTVTVTVDIADIVAAVGIPNAEKRASAMQRALNHLSDSVRAGSRTDSELDQQTTAAAAEATRLKAARAGGTL